MPVTEAVLEHVMVCASCRALFVQLADDLAQRLFEHQHRN
jgi:predicted anti-sigma-YlaC factor YlaD